MTTLLAVPGGLVMAGQLLLSLSILVFIHELGHFLAARMFGMRVEKFYIFFDFWGKKLFSWKRGETEYGIGWFPLGGYVKISGMIDESLDNESADGPPQPWEFRAKPAWQRFIVMIGGIVMNILLGIAVYALWLYHFNKEYLPVSAVNETGIYAHELGEELGFQNGDRIVAVNGSTPERFDDVTPLKLYFGGQVQVDRGGELKTLKIPGNLFKRIQEPLVSPLLEKVGVSEVFGGSNAERGGLVAEDQILSVDGEEMHNFDMFRRVLQQHKSDTVELGVARNGADVHFPVLVDSTGKLGFVTNTTDADIYRKASYTPLTALGYSTKEAFRTFVVQAIGFGKILTGQINARQSIESPIGIARYFGSTWDWSRFWFLTALISIVLAFMNLLPIPALDGGHIVFLLYEMVMRKPVSEQFMMRSQVVGMVFLLALMALVIFNDILKHVFGI